MQAYRSPFVGQGSSTGPAWPPLRRAGRLAARGTHAMSTVSRAQVRTPRRSRGTSLLEVLVTVVIFSIGLLGIAGLQVQSKRSNFEAVQRSTASLLAHDMVERMRTNSGALAAYVQQGAQLGGSTVASEPTPDCKDLNLCSSDALAAHDIWEWERAIDGASESSGGNMTGGLVLPTACITGPVGGGTGLYTVAIAWRGQEALANPTGSACGEGTGRYDNGGEAGVYRRLILVDVFIVSA